MLKTRIATALVLIAGLVAAVVFLSTAQFAILFGLVVLVASWEWANLSSLESKVVSSAYIISYLFLLPGLFLFLDLHTTAPNVDLIQKILGVAVTFWCFALLWVQSYPSSAALWGKPIVRVVMGYLVLIPTWVSFCYLKSLPQGVSMIFTLVALVSFSDTGAYFSGRQWGNKKLAPNVSPGKSWVGFWGGLASASVLAFCLSFFAGVSQIHWLSFIIIGMATSLFSVLGDLLESMVKRHRGIKDSSQLLPGHGGILDRIDSLTAAAPVFSLAFILVQQV